MKNAYPLSYVLVLLTLVTLTFLPNTFAQNAAPENMVRVVYFLPSDRPARPERVEALRQLIKDAQQFYAEQMESHGYGRKTFNIETDKNGAPVVHRIDGKFNQNYYYTGTSDYKIWEEFYEHFDELEHIYLIAIDLSQETLNDGDSCGLGGIGFIPMGGDSWGLFGGNFSIRHRHETSGEEAFGGSAIMPVSGHCFYDTHGFLHPLRVTTHELGHAFGLDHDFRDPDSVVGGRGYQLSECAAEWLSVHRFFNTTPIDTNQSGSVSLLGLQPSEQNRIHLRFQVSDPNGLHQAQLLVPDDGSWGPLMLIGCQELDGQTQTVEFVTTELAVTSPDRVVLQFMDDLGNITWATFLTDIDSLLPPPKVVSIPDLNLAAAIRETLGLGRNDRITDRQMLKLRELNLDDKQIKNLAGLQHAARLQTLLLGKNQIDNYIPLAQLPKLRTLYLWANNINDLSVLPLMPRLEFLDLNWNQITDIHRLANFTKLTTLWIQGNNITNVTPLAGLTNLSDLRLSENKISDVRPLAGLVNLQTLHLQGNPVRDTSILASLTKLSEVDVEIREPTPLVQVDAAQRPPMYWVDAKSGTLHRLIGDEVENLIPTVKNATSLAVDMVGGKLYWTERTGERTGRIRGASLDGTNVKLVKNLTSVPHSIALDAANGKLYLANGWGKIQRMNLDGSNFQSNLITDLNAPRHLTLDVAGGKVYWTEGGKRIRRANLDGSSVQNVSTGLTAPLSLAVASGKVYWTSEKKLQRANLDGTNSEVLETLSIAPTSIAVEAARRLLYLTLPSGEIHQRNLDGSGDQPIVTSLASPSNIVLGISVTVPVPTDTPTLPTEPAGDTAADVNQDRKVNKTDLLLVVTALGESPPANPNFDVNADGTINVADVLLVIEALDDPVAAAAPSFGEIVTALDPARLAMQIDILRAESDGSMKYEHAIAFFQGLLASIRPTETQLLANYPNPFNPETWIPYQLAKASNVQITIYDGRGVVVRQLVLGHQAPGFYTERSRAAYWDGRNALGERVASGIYFYQLQAEGVSSLRKMLILK